MSCENCSGRGTVEDDCTFCGGNCTEYCDECDGSGEVGTEDEPEECLECNGTGEIDCCACGGSGYEQVDCEECNGTGEVPDED
jgi:DnaJ-class molecular chaperone